MLNKLYTWGARADLACSLFARRWFCHAALNVGYGLRCAWELGCSVVFAILPPQPHHSRHECEGFDTASVWQHFLDGLGVGDDQ